MEPFTLAVTLKGCAVYCLMQLFSRSAAQMLYGNQRLQRWCFDVELLYLAQKLSIPVSEVAVTWTEIPGRPSRFRRSLPVVW